MLDRIEKIKKLADIDLLINSQIKIIKEKTLEIEKSQKEIEKAHKELEKLRKERNLEDISDLKLLLFIIDNSDYDEEDFEYHYVYYCPDTCSIKYDTRDSRYNISPYAIDLRKLFVNFDTPTINMAGKPDSEKVNEIVSILEEKINEIFNSTEINSWKELGEHLKQMEPISRPLNKKLLK